MVAASLIEGGDRFGGGLLVAWWYSHSSRGIHSLKAAIRVRPLYVVVSFGGGIDGVDVGTLAGWIEGGERFDGGL